MLPVVPPLELQELENRFSALESTRELVALRDACLASVVQWRWATGEMFVLEPYHSERYQLPSPQWIGAGKYNPGKHCEHGLASDGSVVCMRTRKVFPYSAVLHNVFVIRERSNIWIYRLEEVLSEAKIRLDVISKGEFDPQGLMRVQGLSRVARAVETFVYADGSLVKSYLVSEHRGAGQRCHSSSIRADAITFDYSYDVYGRLDKIVQTRVEVETQEYGAKQVVWERTVRSESVASLSPHIEDLLFRQIVATLRRTSIKSDVYCLLLVYDAEGDPLPPLLALGTDTERHALRQRYPRSFRGYVWNPAELQLFNTQELGITGGGVLDACRRFNEMVREKCTGNPATKLLNNVARRLMAHDWNGVLSCTGDFVVVAVDLETQNDLVRNARASIGKERIALLRSHGWL